MMAVISVSAAAAGLPAAAAEPMTVTPPEVAPGDVTGLVITDDPTIVKALPAHVASWTRSADPKAVAVQFMSGAPECRGAHVTVKETDQTVIVNVDSGTRPAAVGKVCAAFATEVTVVVPLKAPLGNRKVLATY